PTSSASASRRCASRASTSARSVERSEDAEPQRKAVLGGDDALDVEERGVGEGQRAEAHAQRDERAGEQVIALGAHAEDADGAALERGIAARVDEHQLLARLGDAVVAHREAGGELEDQREAIETQAIAEVELSSEARALDQDAAFLERLGEADE